MNARDDSQLRKRYWNAVVLGLVRFHAFSPDKASLAVKHLRTDLYRVMKDPALIYHEEPFQLACDITDHDLPLEKYLDHYDEVLKQAS
jgi:hypothetical protein